jgi:penicillin-binding protein 1C
MVLKRHSLRQRLIVLASIIGAFVVLFPDQLFHDPTSTVLLDSNGELLGAQIAADGQWRFPDVDSVPANLETAILLFEDEYFHWHPGVNPASMMRATWQNVKAKRVVSGGSTITMQVIRLSRKGKSRSLFEKCIELYLAIRLEFEYSKDEIVQLYVSNAPYGGNVVGVEAAAWRYFNRPLDQLSWAEVSTLAVLPNAPALMHPGRNRDALRYKRDRLLGKLLLRQVIDSTEYSLSLMEPIPDQPKTLPADAYHLLDYANKQGRSGQRIHSTIDANLQYHLSRDLNQYVRQLSENQVHNACAMIVSLSDGEVKAYVGNATIPEARSPYVDIIHAPRSSGSILKPFLYARALEAGLIHTNTLLKDVPISIGKYAPLNFDKSFEGVVPAKEALARSLNIPATLLLKQYGLAPFYEDLKELGFQSIDRGVDNYGLTLILGGAEVTLWDLAKSYTSQAMGVKSATSDNFGSLGMKIWENQERVKSEMVFDPGAWWMICEALTDVQRPGLHKDWKRFSSSRRIAWKTGTSHGFRDAWAVGVDGDHLVAVWVGNADGEGRPGLTGTSTASPLMFQAFEFLPQGEWFYKPEGNLRFINLCEKSGLAPGINCPVIQTESPMNAAVPSVCDRHMRIWVNEEDKRVFRNCAEGDIRDTSWFELDPVSGYFYGKHNHSYRPVPPLAKTCSTNEKQNQLAIIYPTPGAEIVIPRNFKGDFEVVQLQATVSDNGTLYWHLDETYIGTTTSMHQLTLEIGQGQHLLTVLDESGQVVKCQFKVYRG